VAKRTTNISAAQIKNSVGVTNWNKLKNLSDAEVEAAAAADPNAKPFTPLELREFKHGGFKPTGKSSK
jgi:hypothetical protein